MIDLEQNKVFESSKPFLQPSNRSGAAMGLIHQNIYVYGGKNKN